MPWSKSCIPSQKSTRCRRSTSFRTRELAKREVLARVEEVIHLQHNTLASPQIIGFLSATDLHGLPNKSTNASRAAPQAEATKCRLLKDRIPLGPNCGLSVPERRILKILLRERERGRACINDGDTSILINPLNCHSVFVCEFMYETERMSSFRGYRPATDQILRRDGAPPLPRGRPDSREKTQPTTGRKVAFVPSWVSRWTRAATNRSPQMHCRQRAAELILTG